MTRIIEIIVTAKGEATLQTKGFLGSACREASKFIEQALGQRLDERFTAECHTQQTNPQRLHEGA